MSYFLPETDPVLTACRGLALTHPDTIALCEQPLYLKATAPAPTRRVALLSGGGSGHDPLHIGLLGAGGLDAVVPGETFASPCNAQIHAAGLDVAQDRDGVLVIIKGYTGDVINFRAAAERLHARGIRVDEVVVRDDIASASAGAGRRGTAATTVVEKLLGAAADRGADLDDLAELGRRAVARSRTLTVCARPHTSPATLRPAFDLKPDHLDYGSGIHGERAPRSIPRPPVADLVHRMLDDLGAGEGPPAEEGVLLVVNGLGGTAPGELAAVAAVAAEQLAARGTTVAAVLTGTLATALDMAGISLTLTQLAPGWLQLWQAPVTTPLTTWPRAAAAPVLITPPTTDRTLMAGRMPGARAVLDHYTQIITQVRTPLTTLDQQSGDGDFADNLLTGLRHALTRVEETGEDGLTAAGAAFLDHVGGTSGPLYGLLLDRLGTATAACPDGHRPALPALTKAFAEGAAAIRRVGEAQPGDRTMLDALTPAVRALSLARESDDSPLTTAALAAIAGARDTAALLGKRGRASYVGAHTLGSPDPGAIGVALLFVALADVYEPTFAVRLPAPGYIVKPAPAP
ncbi:putative dihydroxyacetone kinase (plasmid) [Actinacidiphila reveromycinica]|uniref:Putative dihydroxyacetone kinase n=1 Tax=Actinacidiphila reveromycinica TaxID=659352 RepID=A0A7R6QED9_9ACTN|nr:dihydroxyacetone kinase subunit DhaK [Streptomyces sp. SN-593]BBG20751.1 putative dihydroxyacetone kinase [Streptomyces sp. SN-593]